MDLMLEKIPLTSIETFMSRIEVRGPTQCWWWRGAVRARDNTAIINRHEFDGHYYAARYAWEVVFDRGHLGPGDRITRREHEWDHLCPGGPTCQHTLCMNPDHMKVVTRQEKEKKK